MTIKIGYNSCMEESKDNKNNILTSLIAKGIDFCEKLFFVFLILKLAGKISWPWWWVFSPLWIPVALVCLGIILVVIYLVISNLTKGNEDEEL